MDLKFAIDDLVAGSPSEGRLQALIGDSHSAAIAAGWYTDLATGARKHLNTGQRFMLAVSELAEAMEGHRKDLADDKLPHRPMFEVELGDTLIRLCDTAGDLGLDLDSAYEQLDPLPPVSTNVGEALMRIVIDLSRAATAYYDQNNFLLHIYYASALQRIFRLADYFDLDLGGAYVEKRAYNDNRLDHKPEARLAAGGKAY